METRASPQASPDELRALLSKYDRPGPRYTSYPPAPHFHEGVRSDEARAALGRIGPSDELSLYVHVPFCEERCTYCGCYVIPTRRRDVATAYLAGIARELDLVRKSLGGDAAVDALHLGGGTPTYLAPEELRDLFTAVGERFTVTGAREVAVELDPRVTSPDHLEALAAGGVNRVSLGVQDADDAVQKAIGRNQSWEQTVRAFELCRARGFDGVNIDLVYGLPRQNETSFGATLERVIGLRPNRLALFGYAHVPWLRSHQRAIDEDTLPGAEERVALFLLSHRMLTNAGYVHIGLDHFALPEDELSQAQEAGTLGRNFMGYTPAGSAKVLGFGVSSIGDLQEAYLQNEKKLSRYHDRLARGELPVERGWLASADDRARRYVIHGILCNLHVAAAAFEARHGSPFGEYFASELENLRPLAADGLVEVNEDGVRVTATGRLFVRNVAMVFDAYLGQSRTQGPAYSRTI